MLKLKAKKRQVKASFVANLSAKGFDKSAAEGTSGSRQVGKAIKKYPKTASAVGGAIAFDIFDDIMAKKHNFLNKIEHESRSKFKKTSISTNKSRIKWSSMNKHKKRMHKK